MRARWLALLALLSAATPSAQARDKVAGVIVLMPPPPAPAPPPANEEPGVIVNWFPIPPTAPHPAPPPAARCYAGAVVCPLEDSSRLGHPCDCPSKSGTVTGRGLIPPSVHPRG